MPSVAIDKYGNELIFSDCPTRNWDSWDSSDDYIILPKGSIAKLIGRELTWEDEPVEITENL